jgi:hypothetical protein
MIEVERARHRHPVVRTKHDLGVEAANCAGRWRNNQLAEAIDELGSRENQNRSALIR